MSTDNYCLYLSSDSNHLSEQLVTYAYLQSQTSVSAEALEEIRIFCEALINQAGPSICNRTICVSAELAADLLASRNILKMDWETPGLSRVVAAALIRLGTIKRLLNLPNQQRFEAYLNRAVSVLTARFVELKNAKSRSSSSPASAAK